MPTKPKHGQGGQFQAGDTVPVTSSGRGNRSVSGGVDDASRVTLPEDTDPHLTPNEAGHRRRNDSPSNRRLLFLAFGTRFLPRCGSTGAAEKGYFAFRQSSVA